MSQQTVIYEYDNGKESAPVPEDQVIERGLDDCRHHTLDENNSPWCIDERGTLPAGHSIGPEASQGTAAAPSTLLDSNRPMAGDVPTGLIFGLCLVGAVVFVISQVRKKPEPKPLTPSNHE